MKDKFRKLYEKNRRYWDIWIWLWMMSDDKNTITFTYNSLSGRFGVPKTTIHRVISYSERWNVSKTYIEIESLQKSQHRITFFPNGKKVARKVPERTLYDDIYDWLITFYEDHNFEYVDLPKHKKYIVSICNKIKLAMKGKTEITDENVYDTFKLILTNLDKWWVENQSFRLPTINKHFDTIINQIKKNSHGSSKNRKYAEEFRNTKRADYSDLAES